MYISVSDTLKVPQTTCAASVCFGRLVEDWIPEIRKSLGIFRSQRSYVETCEAPGTQKMRVSKQTHELVPESEEVEGCGDADDTDAFVYS